jgi:predicted Zn-dependent peptidase
MGDLISAFDGVFQTANIWEKLLSQKKTSAFIKLQIEKTKSITPAEIRDCARKYLTLDGFHTVVAGKL